MFSEITRNMCSTWLADMLSLQSEHICHIMTLLSPLISNSPVSTPPTLNQPVSISSPLNPSPHNPSHLNLSHVNPSPLNPSQLPLSELKDVRAGEQVTEQMRQKFNTLLTNTTSWHGEQVHQIIVILSQLSLYKSYTSILHNYGYIGILRIALKYNFPE